MAQLNNNFLPCLFFFLKDEHEQLSLVKQLPPGLLLHTLLSLLLVMVSSVLCNAVFPQFGQDVKPAADW